MTECNLLLLGLMIRILKKYFEYLSADLAIC